MSSTRIEKLEGHLHVFDVQHAEAFGVGIPTVYWQSCRCGLLDRRKDKRRTLIRRRADPASAGVLRGEVSPYMGPVVKVGSGTVVCWCGDYHQK